MAEIPTVPQYLKEREAAAGCRPNYRLDSRRLDPHEAAMVEDCTRPKALLQLNYPAWVVIFLGIAVCGGVALAVMIAKDLGW